MATINLFSTSSQSLSSTTTATTTNKDSPTFSSSSSTMSSTTTAAASAACIKAAARGQLSRVQASLRILRPALLLLRNGGDSSSQPINQKNSSSNSSATAASFVVATLARALQVASSKGHDKVVQYLLQQAAVANGGGNHDVTTTSLVGEMTDDQGYTALELAASQGHEDVVRVWLDFAKNNNKNNNGARVDNDKKSRDMMATALDLAVRRGHVHVVQLLVEEQHCRRVGGNGGLVVVKNEKLLCSLSKIKNPLHTAVMYCQWKCLEYLVAQAPHLLFVPNNSNNNNNDAGHHGYTVLHTAAALGHAEMVQWLWHKRQEYSAQYSCQSNAHSSGPSDHCSVTGNTPLHVAVQHGHLHVVRVLLRHCRPSLAHVSPAPPSNNNGNHSINNRSNSSSSNPYAPAYQDNDDDDDDDSVHNPTWMAAAARNWRGETPLHWAVRKNFRDHCQVLLQECCSNGGGSSRSSQQHNDKIDENSKRLRLSLLLQTADANGQTPLHWAVQFGHLRLAQWIVQQQVENSTTLTCTTTTMANAIRQYPRTRTGYTLLHLAAAGGHWDTVQWLVDTCGVDPFPEAPFYDDSSSSANENNNNNNNNNNPKGVVTPWGLASLAGHDTVAYYLLRYNPMAAFFFYNP